MKATRWIPWLLLPFLTSGPRLAGQAGDSPAIPEVTVVVPVVREVTDFEDFAGRTLALQSVELRPRVSGAVATVAVRPGQAVKKGDVLFEIDPRVYQIELDKADAQLQAQETRLKRANANVARAKKLNEAKAQSADELDRVMAEQEKAESSLRLAKVDREAAQLRLQFTRIVSPLNGKVTGTLLPVGSVVKADETPLGTVISTDPMAITFDIDERTFLRVARAAQDGKGRKLADAPIAFGLLGQEDFPNQARIDLVNDRVDPATGTVLVRAVVPNPKESLLPGLFARVRLTLGEPYEALLVPAGAVVRKDGKAFVYTVSDKSLVQIHEVKLGPQIGGLRAVREGLTRGQSVIVDSSGALKQDARVKARPLPAEQPKDAPERK